MTLEKPDTSGGFRPNIRAGESIGLPAANCLRLDGMLDSVKLSPDLQQALIGMARLRNVVSSLRMEGEPVDLDAARDVLVTGVARNRVERGVLQLVGAYRDIARGRLPELTLAGVRKAHRALFNGVLEAGVAGEFKREQNYIVDLRSQRTVFIPTPPERTAAELDALFAWCREREFTLPAPVLAAVFFAEFQAVHPFVDGNGRLGRYLNLAILVRLGLRNAHSIPLDTRFFRTSEHYYGMLSTTNTGKQYALWTRYFVGELQKAYKLALSRADLRTMVDRFSRPSTRAVLEWVLSGGGEWFSHGDYPNPKDYSDAMVSAALKELVDAEVLERRGERKGRAYRLRSRFLAKLYGKEA